MPDIPFPRSSTPGSLPGEGEGRLINAYVEKAGDTIYIRRAPGLSVFANAGGQSGIRGMAGVEGTLYVAYEGSVVSVSPSTVVTYSGLLNGSNGVTWARNNRVTGGTSTPDLVVVREDGEAFLVTTSSVGAYPDDDLPDTVNSVAFLDGYFLFTVPDGRIFASNLNAVAVSALSFATAESRPDGLKRGIVHGGVFYAMGTATIEPWINTAGTPFPLSRGTSVIPVGILTTMAVAGFEEGWDHNPIFVGHDGTVRELRGYQTAVISTPDVERFIAASTTASLRAFVYTFRGHAIWCLTSNVGTWCYDVATQSWHERDSEATVGWRGLCSVKSNGRWRMGDAASASIFTVDDAVATEAGDALVCTVESLPMREYPARAAIPAVFLNFTKAVATVNVSWSHDGGSTWSTPVSRSIGAADKLPVRINRVGLATHHGLRLRWTMASAVPFAFLGASVPKPAERAP